MSHNDPTARIPVEFLFDYICPFCYVGSARLERLATRYPLDIRYRFIEIHPDNPPQGQPLSALGYPAAQWQRMTETLEAMVAEDGLAFTERRFTTNSRDALRLASTVLAERPAAFPPLHRALFRAYFAQARNIGDRSVLQSIAETHAVGDLLDVAWNTRESLQRLLEDVEAAKRVGLTGVPTLVVGERTFSGVVSIDTLEAALG